MPKHAVAYVWVIVQVRRVSPEMEFVCRLETAATQDDGGMGSYEMGKNFMRESIHPTLSKFVVTRVPWLLARGKRLTAVHQKLMK